MKRIRENDKKYYYTLKLNYSYPLYKKKFDKFIKYINQQLIRKKGWLLEVKGIDINVFIKWAQIKSNEFAAEYNPLLEFSLVCDLTVNILSEIIEQYNKKHSNNITKKEIRVKYEIEDIVFN